MMCFILAQRCNNFVAVKDFDYICLAGGKDPKAK